MVTPAARGRLTNLRSWSRSTTRCRTRATDIWRADGRHFANHVATVALVVALGVAVLLSAPERFSSPGYAVLRATGGMPTWGVVMTVAGLWLAAVTVMSTRAVRLSLMATAALFLFIAYTFAAAQADNSGASPWGWLLFGGLASRHAMQALWFPARDERA